MTKKKFDQLQPGDRVRVKSGKVYQLMRTRDGSHDFRQWREDRRALYGRDFLTLKPENCEPVEYVVPAQPEVELTELDKPLVELFGESFWRAARNAGRKQA